jgi:acyl phosphate:glycerol-3-phosphate acyltransferase
VRAVLGLLAAYLIGAVPVGWVVARAFGIEDIRRHGSGNIGATNVLRTAGRLPAVLTLLADVVKGYVAVVVGAGAAAPPALVAGCAVAAVVGNCWSVFLGFRGGKGVATGLGAALRLAWLAVVPAALVWLAVTATFRYVSLASVLSAACVPLGALLLGYSWPIVAGALALSLIIIVRHRENIGRLLAGTERQVSLRRRAA